jgi:hypothetical protein
VKLAGRTCCLLEPCMFCRLASRGSPAIADDHKWSFPLVSSGQERNSVRLLAQTTDLTDRLVHPAPHPGRISGIGSLRLVCACKGRSLPGCNVIPFAAPPASLAGRETAQRAISSRFHLTGTCSTNSSRFREKKLSLPRDGTRRAFVAGVPTQVCGFVSTPEPAGRCGIPCFGSVGSRSLRRKDSHA